MTTQEIAELIALLKRTDINDRLDQDERGFTTEKTKRRLGALSVKYLKRVAKSLGLASADHTVNFNPGGPGIAGETWLQSTKVAVLLAAGNEHGVLYRCCARVEIPGRQGKPRTTWSARYPNRWCAVDALNDLPTFITTLDLCAADKPAVSW